MPIILEKAAVTDLTIWEDIEKTIIAYFGENWTSTQIQYPNTIRDMSAYGSWVSINIVSIMADRLTITGSTSTGILYKGEVIVNVYRGFNKGTGTVKQYIDDIINLFRYVQLTIDGGNTIQFSIPQHYVIGMSMDNVLWQETISIPFECLV